MVRSGVSWSTVPQYILGTIAVDCRYLPWYCIVHPCRLQYGVLERRIIEMVGKEALAFGHSSAILPSCPNSSRRKRNNTSSASTKNPPAVLASIDHSTQHVETGFVTCHLSVLEMLPNVNLTFFVTSVLPSFFLSSSSFLCPCSPCALTFDSHFFRLSFPLSGSHYNFHPSLVLYPIRSIPFGVGGTKTTDRKDCCVAGLVLLV